MIIKEVLIENIGPIEMAHIKLDEKFNIICGPNGVGKTTILDCISQAFSMHGRTIKRRSNSVQGQVKIETEINSVRKETVILVDNFSPDQTAQYHSDLYQHAKDVVVFKTHRDIPYQRLGSIGNDPQKNEHVYSNEIIQGSQSMEIKNWFVNRHLWSKHEDHLDAGQLQNLELAKECIKILNDGYAFEKVLPASNDIILSSPNGSIYFEYLSSGYKSCLAILLGIIKEIEFRYNSPSKCATDFSGVIIIDEIDLHLHPTWQAKIYSAIKWLLPNAQIITSTHSPHLLQAALAQEIFPFGENGQITQGSINSEFGYQGWSVEEILENVMGMHDTRSNAFSSALHSFNQALDEENTDLAIEKYEILMRMLHPNNVLKKLLSIQISSLKS